MKNFTKYKIIPDLDLCKHKPIWKVKKLRKFLFISYYKTIAYYYSKDEAKEIVKHLKSEITI